jgi:ribosome-binding protein aMBF1 (putative translation factor)
MSTTRDLLNDLDEFDNTPEGRGYDLRLDLSSIIVRQLAAKGWTQKKLADEVGVKESFITRLIHSSANCTFDTAGRVLFALGVRAELKETTQAQAGPLPRARRDRPHGPRRGRAVG